MKIKSIESQPTAHVPVDVLDHYIDEVLGE